MPTTASLFRRTSPLPDSTIPQLNRVSDFGFQTNKIIAKGSADLIYAFFPVERFLTPGIGKIFLKAPAVFLAPPQLFIDPHIGSSWKPWSHLSKSDVNDVKNLIEDVADNACEARPEIQQQDKTKICPGSSKDSSSNDASSNDSGSNDPQRQRDQKMIQLLMMDCTCPVPPDNGAGEQMKSESGQIKSESCKNLPNACNAAIPIQKAGSQHQSQLQPWYRAP